MREAVMSGFETRGRRDHARKKYDFRFVVWTVAVAAAAILLSLAIGVPAVPDSLMLVAL
jgi:hypothetical protein